MDLNMFYLFLILGVACEEFATQIEDPGPHYDCPYCQPEQIHIAFGDNINDIVVTWSTFNDTTESRVKFGENKMNQEVNGSQVLFVDNGPLKALQYFHKATLKGLKFNTTYFYKVGSVFGWSEKFSFNVPPEGEDWTVRAIIFGDLGVINAHSLPYLQEETENDNFDVVLHVGDFAYDMYTDNGEFGNQFMRQIQPIAAFVPYMTCPGNHEAAYNFSHYKNHFSMPGDKENMYYSWNLGPVHFISIDTEAYFFDVENHIGHTIRQYNWLVEDLKEAVKPENRAKHPWIIIYGHRPMICSDVEPHTDKLDAYCYNNVSTRVGLEDYGLALEPVLKDYGVDLVIWAHEHSYERLWPVYDLKVYNGSTEHPYTNPRAPVHIITGSAGCEEDTDFFIKNPQDWSAIRNSDYGYTRFKAYNKSHIYMEQVSVDLKGEVIDSFWLIKDTHEPYYNLPSTNEHYFTNKA